MANARTAVREASDSPVFQVVARSGFAVNGLIHLIVGGIAIGVAVSGGRGGEADPTGALKGIAQTPGGFVVLWVALVCLFALGLWQVAAAVLVPRGGDEPRDRMRRWGRRVTEAGKSLVYFALGATTLAVALGSRASSSESATDLSAQLLASPGGVFVLVAIGLAFAGAGIGFISIGVRRTFRKLIVVPEGAWGAAVTVLGLVGYIAKGIALGVVGVLLVVAALALDAERATGLDGALKSLVALPFGVAILIAVGIGLIAYGLYLIARTRLARF
ncbi:DUF1206 domain-containing protein [Herbiconiux sp. A18JL235]|uniref:DUF1206 domain-containing protein n=1 Tax=Herbiconiux sp. A18JL235 TaxID=3152363 RepID=A0AB39BKD0_9MICO